jgi:DNA-binding XRE family transcriptional regulator
MELTRKRIPEKLKQIRATLGLTLFDMAQRISDVVQVTISSENVADFEQDIEVPALEVVLAYARIGKTQMESIIDDNLEITEVLDFHHRESSSA